MVTESDHNGHRLQPKRSLLLLCVFLVIFRGTSLFTDQKSTHNSVVCTVVWFVVENVSSLTVTKTDLRTFAELSLTEN